MDQRLVFGLGVSCVFGFGRWLLPAVPKWIASAGLAFGIGLVLWSSMPTVRTGPAILALLSLCGLAAAASWQLHPLTNQDYPSQREGPASPTTPTLEPHEPIKAPSQNKMRAVQPAHAQQTGAAIDQRVITYNQTGGIAAHTVNLAPADRQLDQSTQARLLHEAPRDRPVEVEAPSNDREAENYAGQITAFLRQNGYDVGFSLAMGRPFPNGIETVVAHDKTYISVGYR